MKAAKWITASRLILPHQLGRARRSRQRFSCTAGPAGTLCLVPSREIVDHGDVVALLEQQA